MAIPRITVVMPVWNGEKYLTEAIDSILVQTLTDFEFLILDDGSTDSSPDILADYAAKDSRIRVIRLEHNGIVNALNRGVSEAKAAWIARMDCDDVAFPERLQKQLDVLESNGAVLCHTNIEVVDDMELNMPPARFVHSKALLALKMCHHCPIVHPTVMFRRDAFIDIGGYTADERHAEDYGLWGKFINMGHVIGIPEPLLKYRVHEGSISKRMTNIQKDLTHHIAIRHCMEILDLNRDDAEQAFTTLSLPAIKCPLKSWMRFMLRTMPRSKWQSIEMWAWALMRMLRIMALKCWLRQA